MVTVDTTIQIRDLQVQLRERLTAIENQLGPLQAEAVKLRTQLSLLDNVLRAEQLPDLSGSQETPFDTGEQRATTKEAVGDVVVAILEESDAPVHIGEIRRKYLERGCIVPGKGTESNLLAYMVRDSRFVRTAKGTYGLAVEGSGAAPPQTVKKKRRRRARKN